MCADAPNYYFSGRFYVEFFLNSMPMTEINMFLCVPTRLQSVLNANQVLVIIKCLSMPYYDRAVMEFIVGGKYLRTEYLYANIYV